jgi:formate dehydrogenase subunit beta
MDLPQAFVFSSGQRRPSDAVRQLLRELLSVGAVSGVICQTDLGDGATFPCLSTRAEDLDRAQPLAPVLAVNTAGELAQIQLGDTDRAPIAVVLRPCEERAFVELIKLRQFSAEHFLVLGLDCAGVYPIDDYRKRTEDGEDTVTAYEQSVANGQELPDSRETCRICTRFVPRAADLAIWSLGSAIDTELPLSALSERGAAAVGKVGGVASSSDGNATPAYAAQAHEAILSQRQPRREERLAELSQEAHGPSGLLAVFAKCVACHGCRSVCPICCCRQCFFESGEMHLGPDSYLRRADARGALAMPSDRLLFHLGRMSHMAFACVGCGVCEEACPVDIPVSQIFQLAQAGLERDLGYVPGQTTEGRNLLAEGEPDELAEVERPYGLLTGERTAAGAD